MPRKPYRSPRDWLQADQTRLFGNTWSDGLNWRTPQSALEQALLVAAQRQNDLAFQIRIRFNYNKATSALAAFADLHPDTVRDILNGSKHATLTVLHVLTAGVSLNLTATARVIDESSAGARAT